ncbi:MAG: GntR family transcriptional regulator [Gemmobacter sp.]
MVLDPATRPGALPLHQQVSELLARDIAAGRLMDGERLPPERAMAADLGVAVGTLRRALADLADRGMLNRVQGSGNYVRASAAPAGVYALFRLELIEGGGLPAATVLSVERLPKAAMLPPFGTDPEGHRIRRLRRLSGRVAAVEEIWLDGAYTPRIDAAELSDSLYLHYRTRLNLWITRAEDRIGQGAAPDWAPPAFAPPPGTPLPLILRRSWDRGGTCAEVSLTWYDPAVAAYVARLK